MDPAIKNLREWVVLLFTLFCVLDIAGVQYGLLLARTAAEHPNPLVGQIEAIIHGSRGAWHVAYVTPRQAHIFHGLLAAAGASLLASLSLIVWHGVRLVRANRRRTALTRGKRLTGGKR
jgi:hypothetical protein